ncbi:MAG: DUF402 domain-containing protein [Lachnospiraceae bacterium]|nr:DUF402 domain-containing protein [Lachnospiraceae bacterium]
MAEKTIYRKRFVPLETIALKDDCILFESDTRIITCWKSLKPRKDIGGGISAYFMDKGIKVSKVFSPDGHFVHWYCDMIRTVSSGDSITFIDLLIDVVIDPQGRIHILDAAEAADALRDGLITADILCDALRAMDTLLADIDAGRFSDYTEWITRFEDHADI